MHGNDRQSFAALWRVLLIIYHAERRVAELSAYWNSLKDYRWEEVYQAAWQHIQCPKHGRFFPKPVDFIHHIGQARAEDGWAVVFDHLTRVGCYGTVTFSDPLILSVITKLGGWAHLCQTPRMALIHLENTFKYNYQQAYCSYRPFFIKADERHEYLPHDNTQRLVEKVTHPDAAMVHRFHNKKQGATR